MLIMAKWFPMSSGLKSLMALSQQGLSEAFCGETKQGISSIGSSIILITVSNTIISPLRTTGL